MAVEYEIRFLEIDVADLVTRLDALGAKKVGDWFQERFVFDLPTSAQNDGHQWIRLRTNGEESTIAYKHVHANKIDGTEEIEFTISDFHAAAQLLERCGFIKQGPQQNKRMRYILDSVEIDIDTWPRCPSWVEIEADSEEKVRETCGKLGFDIAKGVTSSVLDVLVSYGYDRNSMTCTFDE